MDQIFDTDAPGLAFSQSISPLGPGMSWKSTKSSEKDMIEKLNSTIEAGSGTGMGSGMLGPGSVISGTGSGVGYLGSDSRISSGVSENDFVNVQMSDEIRNQYNSQYGKSNNNNVNINSSNNNSNLDSKIANDNIEKDREISREREKERNAVTMNPMLTNVFEEELDVEVEDGDDYVDLA